MKIQNISRVRTLHGVEPGASGDVPDGAGEVYVAKGWAVELTDYEAATKDELKTLLEERGLQVSGTKDELIERLRDDDEAH
jgi:hypothetical protein